MIKTEKLTKKFDNKTALDAVDINVTDGAIYGLIGTNGSGKSTLLRILSGIYKKDSGEVTVDGAQVYNNVGLKNVTAFVGDTPYFFTSSTIEKEAKFYEKVYKGFDRELFDRLIKHFPLDLKDKTIALSKGMQRQASLLLAVCRRPKYLFLDEAFDGLDPAIRGVVKTVLIEGAEKGSMTTIISSHNLREVEGLCDQVGIIHNGKMVYSGDIATLKEGICKVQAAFSCETDESLFEGFEILKYEKKGAVIGAVVKGDKQLLCDRIAALSPLFSEYIEPSLEEIFTLELRGSEYDVEQILY